MRSHTDVAHVARKQGPSRRGNAGAGRKLGSRNKITRAFKEAVLVAFDALGGAKGLEDWGRKNPTPFYQIAARLIPYEVIGPGPGGAHLVKRVIFELHPDA